MHVCVCKQMLLAIVNNKLLSFCQLVDSWYKMGCIREKERERETEREWKRDKEREREGGGEREREREREREGGRERKRGTERDRQTKRLCMCDVCMYVGKVVVCLTTKRLACFNESRFTKNVFIAMFVCLLKRSQRLLVVHTTYFLPINTSTTSSKPISGKTVQVLLTSFSAATAITVYFIP